MEKEAGSLNPKNQPKAVGNPSAESEITIPRTIRVLMPDDSVVEMDLDEYLKGVVPAEMGTQRPLEALKAQAVAARCYAVVYPRHSDKGADVCTTAHCQVWKPDHYPDTDQAVEETSRVVATYQRPDGAEAVISAFYFGYCDGHTRNSEDVWRAALSYCRSVPCPQPFPNIWGHGVGMCQEGALAMAGDGASYEDILTHYYTGIRVVKAKVFPLIVPAESVIRGQVVDGQGRPRPSLGVELRSGEWHDRTITAGDGRFAFSNLKAGEFSLMVPGTEARREGILTNGSDTVELELVAPLPEPEHLIHVDPKGQRILGVGGTRFFVWGVNYEGYFDRAWRLWDDDQFDPDLIDRDFAKASDAGFNVVRIFVQHSLAQDVRGGNFLKLDTVVELAQHRNLRLLLTFNDYHSLDLAAVAQLDAQIAAHVADEPTIMGYDLENEPGFYAILSAQYPPEYQPLAHTTALIDHYGERMSQDEVDAWRETHDGRRVVPQRLSSWLGYLYANAYFLYLDFLRAASDWVRRNGGTSLHYLDSPEADVWRPFLHVLDDTISAWIRSQMDLIRPADPCHLITVGYNNYIFAGMQANSMLDFQSYHRYTSASYWGLKGTFNVTDKLAQTLPTTPLTLGEFGYSNASGSTPENSQPIDPGLTAIHEAAVYLYLRSQRYGGGFKWMLNNVWGGSNPYENNFGVFAADDRPKPIRDAVAVLSAYDRQSPARGEVTAFQDEVTGAGYIYRAEGALFVGASGYKGEGLTFQPQAAGQVFLTWSGPQQVTVQTIVDSVLTLDPASLVEGWDTTQSLGVYRLREGQEPLPVQSFPVGEPAHFAAQAGPIYALVPEPPLPPEPTTWYFAEGTTQQPFDALWVILMNPQTEPANVRLTFMKPDGSTVVRRYTVPPTSQFSVRVNDIVPNEALSTAVESDIPVYAERTMYFHHDGHTSRGVSEPAQTWYFAEGFTGPGFDTWILLQNPNSTPTHATVTFAREDGSQVRREFTLAPTSRLSIWVDQIVPDVAVSTTVQADQPIIAERAMYFGGGGGHATMGVSELSQVWYLTEGYTGPGFDTWILLQNPHPTPANVTVYFLLEEGEPVVHRFQIRPTARYTLYANQVVPNQAFGTRVESDLPIVAERAMYFAQARGGHCSIGATAGAHQWYLPEGSTAAGFSTFILVANPNAVQAQVDMTFMTAEGTTVERHYTMVPNSRLTVHVNLELPGVRFATRIVADQLVIAERAMYFNNGQGGTASLGTPGP
jgi:hypothetical protein